MRIAAAVLRKELLEMVGDRHSFRGALVQAAVVIATTGILVPLSGSKLWADSSAPGMLFMFFPAVVAATVAADAFAGERERRTLETLLASPAPVSALFAGKTAAAVLAAFTVSALSLAASAFVAVSRGAVGPSAATAAVCLVGAVAASLLTAAIAVVLSVYVPVARSAQQAVSMVSLVLAVVIGEILDRLHLPPTPDTLLRVDLVLAVSGLMTLAVAARLFRRDRLIEGV
jgi:ABC-2 type transport system permease protein